MLEPDAGDLQWLDDLTFDETSDLLYTPALAFVDDSDRVGLLPRPASELGTGRTRDDSEYGSHPMSGAASDQISCAPQQERADTAGKAAAKLARKAEQNRRAG